MKTIHGRHRKRRRTSTTLRHNEQNYLAHYLRKMIPWEMLLLLSGKARNGTDQVKKCCNRITNFLYHHYQQILFFGALLLFLELKQKRTKTFKDTWYKSKMYLVNGCQWAVKMFLELVQEITKTTVDSCYKANMYFVCSYQWTSQKFFELTGKATKAVKNCWHRITNLLYYHRQPISLPKLKPETRKTIITFCQKTKAYLDDLCQRIIQQFLALVQIITKTTVDSSHMAYTYLGYSYQWTSQKFLELVQIITKTTVDSSHMAYTYLVYSYQWTSQKFLELARKGAQNVRQCWHWTKEVLYHYYQQISFIGALLLFVKLLTICIKKVMNILVTVYRTFIANALKILSSILLLLLIVMTVTMNYQLMIERNQLQEERKMLQAERRELIAEWKEMSSEWHRLRRMKETPPHVQDEGFIYYVKKAGNIIEAALPFTKLFGW